MKILLKLVQELKGKYIVKSKADRKSHISGGTVFFHSQIDKYSYTGYDCEIIYTEIGKYCSISNRVIIGGASHPVDNVSTSPIFLNGTNCFKKHLAKIDYNPYKKTVIGNDVWIGECAIIKAGVVIGNGCVIGAGSVVTHDVPPYEIWAGNPAKKIRDRFSEDIKKQLEDTKWWDLDDGKLKKIAHRFDLVQSLLDEIGVASKDE